ncbi:ubiquinol-cytochrome-c reductase complex assembly factor 1 [Pycnococcus provasolii]
MEARALLLLSRTLAQNNLYAQQGHARTIAAYAYAVGQVPCACQHARGRDSLQSGGRGGKTTPAPAAHSSALTHGASVRARSAALIAWQGTSARSYATSATATEETTEEKQATSTQQTPNRAKMFRAKPVSLATQTEPWPMLRPDAESTWWRRALLFVGGYYTSEGQRMRAARSLFRSALAQAEEQTLADGVGADLERFYERYMMTSLHIWMLLRRLQKEGDDGKKVGQELYDLFTHHVEKDVYNEGVQVRVSKWLAEIEKTFYGSCLAYDKALRDEATADAELDRALARNVFGAEEEGGAGWGKSAQHLTRYVRRELACLEKTPTEAIMKGWILFSSVK